MTGSILIEKRRRSIATTRLLRLVALCILATTAFGSALAAENTGELIFVRRIGPLFHEKCLACHGKDEAKIKGGFDLRSLASMLKGGDSGKPGLVPGRPEQSPLYLAATRTQDDWEAMPPKEADKLYAEQVGWIREWITAGAAWPDEARSQLIANANEAKWSAEDGVPVKTSGGLSPEWTNRKYKPEGLWAYQPVKKPKPPIPTGQPIDAFIAAKFPQGLQPAPAADRGTLIRRATFDLTGLPPSPAEVKAYVEDARPDAEAFANVVERLLASPHYGERMAQHWLDVTRYADSSGFANDYERGNAWRYRDYVVRAFNSDRPYDQFVREQIAGDEIDAKNPELLVATGFLRMGPWELTGMEVPKIARQRFLDDVVNSVGETFLAQSLQCARCHDHKFDPVPTRDYYAIQAVFATTQLAERQAPFLPGESAAGFEEQKFLEAMRQDYERTLKQVNAKITISAARAWLKEKGRAAAEFEKVVEELAAKTKAGDEQGVSVDRARKVMQQRKIHPDLIPPKDAGFSPEDFGNERVARKGLERLRWELERYKPFAFAVYNGRTPNVNSVNSPQRIPDDRLTAGELEESCILTGGDPFARGENVQSGVLSVLPEISSLKSPPAGEMEGRRRTFAGWATRAENPLFTRAIVNRIWLWHFNQPIAGNPNNFGSTGKKPTHPELLDWLAATFVEKGWSFKAMHRVIMASEAYQRGGVVSNQLAVISRAGSTNTATLNTDALAADYMLFKPRRLSAEELRDAMLAATGELNPTLGGIPNRPEINLEAALQPRQVMGTFASAWVPNPKPEQRHRRSLYALKLRGLTDPMLEVFNAPSPDFSCERRESSTVTPQVFSLFNGQNSHSRALALAARVLKETKSDEQAIARCFALTYGRAPRASELAACLAHWREVEAMSGPNSAAPDQPPLLVRREAVEENTGEKFTFDEKLHAYSEFIPDAQPADFNAHTRSLADVCLALFNSNEFAYVY